VKIPKVEEREAFYWDLIDKCLVSRGQRKAMYESMRSYSMFGSAPGQDPAIFNKIDASMDSLASFLFAAETTRFSIKLGAGVDKKMEMPKIPPLIERLNDRWQDSNCDMMFGMAVKDALTYATIIFKLVQRKTETHPFVIYPGDFGVLREDIPLLDRQEAFVHVFMTTKDQLRRDLENHPNKDLLLSRINANRKADDENELPAGVQRIITSQVSPNIQGNVNAPLAGAYDAMVPRTAEELIEMKELWVWDDTFKSKDGHWRDGGWRVVTMADPGITIYDRPSYDPEDTSKSMFLQSDHPFTKICPNPMSDYFWGQSEVQKCIILQGEREHRLGQIHRLMDRMVDPAKSMFGVWGAVDEKNDAARLIGALISSQDPLAKITEHKPLLPPDVWTDIHEIDMMFDETIGLSNVLKGKGEAGVRSKGQTDRLAQLGSSRSKKRALVIEDSLERIGLQYVQLDQKHNKDPLVMIGNGKEEEFIAEQFTKDYMVKVDAHSSSPVFIEDQKNGAYAMFDRHIIDGEAVLDAEQPQNIQALKVRYKEMQHAQAVAAQHKQQMEEAQALQKSGGGGKLQVEK
jgi:hypothetical protein